VVPCLYEGKPVNYTVQMFLNDGTAPRQRCLVEGGLGRVDTTINHSSPKHSHHTEPPIACGREIWGFPKKYAEAELRVEKDTLTGTHTARHDTTRTPPHDTRHDTHTTARHTEE